MSRQRIALIVTLAALGGLAAPGAADAHVAPSPTENNRYLKMTLLPDGVRLSYTVFYGERPGAGERQRMDKDANGSLDDDESRSFGAVVRDEVAAHVRLVVDGHAVAPAELRVEDVGLGTPLTSGGSFSIDLLLHAPTQGAGAHALTLDDSWIAPSAGEHEIFVEESPGVRVVAAHLVATPSAPTQIRWSFRGNPTAGERAVHVEWTVDDAAFREAARTSAPKATAAAHGSRRILWIALAAIVLGGIAVVALSRRQKT
jgi:hypothetical protein